MSDSADILPIVVVSDVVCPWCFIGKRRLEQAIALKPDLAVTVQWHPYFLNDWIPREGISREQYLITKFGSVERYAGMAERIAAAAAAEGLAYAVDKIARQPNTLDCHRLITWAEEIGAQEMDARTTGAGGAMKQRLMELYFSEGGDLSDRETLVAAAAACGLDADEIRRRLASDRDVAAVTRAANAAKEGGIDGVPCFIFGGVLAVSGAQSPDYLAETMTRAAEQRQRRTAEQPAT
jgi:predicted DsbA family dithiol-disulfide isomerase